MSGKKRRQELTPEEEDAYEAGLARVAEEKHQALLEPGPSWKIWFLYDHARWWMALLFLIVDAWIITYFVEPIDLVGLLLALGATLYLEFLVYSYFWHRPSSDGGASMGKFRRRWYRPVRYGRWTSEAERARHQRSGSSPGITPGAPDPQEFL